MIGQTISHYNIIEKLGEGDCLHPTSKKRNSKTKFLLIVVLSIVFHWSCKKDNVPVQPNSTEIVTYAGTTYHTVQIGSQCWLKENLNVGTMIRGTDTAKNNKEIEKYCYDNDTINCNIYGGLYQWNEAMQYDTTPGTRGICPPGWHIPTLLDYETLRTTVGRDGNALKAIGQGTGGGAGTNTSGFSALFAGSRDILGFFGYVRLQTRFWSSTEYDSTSADHLGLVYDVGGIALYAYSEDMGFSVRCIKD